MTDASTALSAGDVREQLPAAGKDDAAPERERATKVAAMFAAPARSFSATFFTLLTCAALAYGWHLRSEKHLTAESGLGYMLGIAGSVMMLALLLYPMRKRLRSMRRLGAAKHWFRIHMILGIVGPVLILFHSNFNLGSLNSSIALISMLLVAGSGLIGRYIYSKIHFGLYGRRTTLVDLQQVAENSSSRLGEVLAYAPELRVRLQALAAAALAPPGGLLRSIWRILYLGARTRLAYSGMRGRLLRGLKAEAKRAGWSRKERRRRINEASDYLDGFFTTIRRISAFSFYERLFALWHVLHLPLFLILMLAAVVHILAVHMY